MPTTKSKRRMRRTQVCMMQEQWDTVWQLAEERGVSFAQVVREAIECLGERNRANRREQVGSLDGLIGILEGLDPNASVDVDRILYETGDEP